MLCKTMRKTWETLMTFGFRDSFMCLFVVSCWKSQGLFIPDDFTCTQTVNVTFKPKLKCRIHLFLLLFFICRCSETKQIRRRQKMSGHFSSSSQRRSAKTASPLFGQTLQLLLRLSFLSRVSICYILCDLSLGSDGGQTSMSKHIIDRRMEVITSGCLGEGFNPLQSPDHSSTRAPALITDWA